VDPELLLACEPSRFLLGPHRHVVSREGLADSIEWYKGLTLPEPEEDP